MLRSRILGLALPALLLLAAGRSANAQDWQFPITVSTADEVGLSPDTVKIGANQNTTDGVDLPIETVSPANPAGGLSIRSIHRTSEPGYTTFRGTGAIVPFQTDFRAPIRPGDRDKVWVLSVGYYGNALSADLTLSWQNVSSVPQGLAVHIGIPDDFGPGGSGGTDMRSHGSITVHVGKNTAADLEVHVGSTTPLAPFVSVTPPTGTIQVNGQFPLTADIANAGNPTWTVNPANQGGVVLGAGTTVNFQSSVAGTFTVTATVTGTQVPTTVSSSATITVTSTPVVLPEIDAFSPMSGPIGTHVQIIGQRFSAIPTKNIILFTGPAGGLVQADLDPNGIATTTELDVTVPPGTIDGPIRVTTPQGTAISAQPFHVLFSQGGAQGYIAPINPRIGVPGVSYVQTENLTTSRWDASTAILFNGIPAQGLTAADFGMGVLPDSLLSTPQTITRQVPAAAQTGLITSITGSTNLTTLNDFTILQPPVIQVMNPTFWDADKNPNVPSSITLTGFNFVQYPAPAGSPLPQFRYEIDYPGIPDVSRDPDSHTNAVQSFPSADVTLAASGVTHSMTIFPRPSILTGPIHFKEEMLDPITGQWDLIGEATTPVFTVIRTPQIVGFTPTSGHAGVDIVTITGNFFDPSDPLNNVVGFAGLSPDGKTVIQDASTAPVQSVSPDGKTLTVIVPRDALTGPISVTVHGKYVLSTQVFTVLPSVTIVPGFGRIRAGTGQIPVLAIVGGLGPGLDHSVSWSISTTTPGANPGTLTLPTDMASPTAQRQVYTPPANIPASALDRGLQVTLTATTFYGAATGTQGVGSATYFVLPPLDFAVAPAAIVINNLAQFGTQPLTATSAAGIDLTQIQWSFGGDLLTNSSGPGTLSSLTGASTTYTPPPTVDKEPTTGFIRAQIPSLNLSKDIPVTIHQPPLQIVSLTANQTQATAVVNWQLAPGQLATSSLDWGTSAGGPYPNHLANELSTTPSGLGQATLTGLSPSSAYYFQVTATAPGFLTAMRAGNFTTPGAAAITLTPPTITLRPGDQWTFNASIANGPPGAGLVFMLVPQNGSSTAEASLQTTTDNLHAVVNILANAKAGDVLTLTASASPLAGWTAPMAVSTITIAGHPTIAVTPGLFGPIPVGGTQKFIVSVTGAVNPGVTSEIVTTPDVPEKGTLVADPTTPGGWIYTAPADTPNTADPNSDPNLLIELRFHSADNATVFGKAVGAILSPIRITISPAVPQTVKVGGRLAFTAKLKNATSIGVRFLVNGEHSGEASLGTITDAIGDGVHAATYTAPATVPGVPVTIQAQSSQDPTRVSAAVPITILPGVAVAVAPSNANVGLGQTQKFTATVTGSNGDSGVTWSVNGIPGGSTTLGTLSADGTYTAPAAIADPTHPIVTIQATSTADPNAPAGTATVVLQPGVVVHVTPSSPNVHVGDTISVFANVTNFKTTDGLIWTVNGIKNGDATVGQLSFPNSPKTDLVIYTPPAVAPAQPVRITAQSVEDNTKADSTTITVLPRQAVVNPPKVAVAVGSTFQFIFQDAASGAPIPNASWQVVEGAAYGTIDGNGKYTAPAAVPDPDSATVQATSKDDPRITATAKVTIIGSIQVKPAESTLKPNDQVTFTATDSTGTPMTMVQWVISGGQSGVGSIDPASGVYTAPALILAPLDVTIQAITPAGPGSALVHLVPTAQAISVKVTATAKSVVAGHSITAFASLSNFKTDPNVAWTVNGVPNGNDQVGRITLANAPRTDLVVYTAPAGSLAQPVQITATSIEDNSKSDSVAVAVTPRPAVVSPANPTASLGQTVPFFLLDAETNGRLARVAWSVNGTAGGNAAVGTIDPSGLYVAPAALPNPPQVTISGTSQDDPAVTASTTVTLTQLPTITVNPAEKTVTAGAAAIPFQALDAAKNVLANVTWEIASPAAGGGSIDPKTGVYTPPPLVPGPTDVKVVAFATVGTGGQAALATGQAVVHVVPAAQAVDLLSGPTVRFLPNDARAVDIVWTTGVPSDSTVELGTTAGVYPSRFSVPDLTQNHVVHVTGLLPGATYHYDIRSKAAGRAELVSGDNTFTALGEFVLDVDPHVADAFLLVDNVKYQGTELPRTFVWPIGQQHTVQPALQYQAGPNTLFVFSNWDDPSKPADPTKPVTVSVPASGHASLKAVYAPQYKLTLDTSPVDVRLAGFGPKGQGYYGAGETARISAQLTAVAHEQSYAFQKWIVDGHDQAGAVLTLVMDQPHLAVAVYVPVDTTGPAVVQVVATPNPTAGAAKVRLEATISDIGLGDSPIQAAEYFVDNPGAPGSGTAMAPVDGKLDSTQEDVFAIVDASSWKVGDSHKLYVRGQDAAGNWGNAKSYQVFVSASSIPPSAVNDLRARAQSTTAIGLTWTAPGSNGATGQADHYEIRYSTSPITGDADFAGATVVPNPPKPQPAGSQEAFVVTGLNPETHYWFALKAFAGTDHPADQRASTLSNVADAITFGIPPRVVSTSPADGDTGVAINAPIVVTFDKAMAPASVQITLSPAVTNLSPTWSADGKTVTLGHDPFIGDGTQYTVQVAQGQDLNGNALAGAVAFSFTTVKPPGGLAETPWPMFRHDPLHTGRNAYSGPAGAPTGPTWAAPVPSQFSSPAVGIDQTIYVGSQGSGLVAIAPDGTIKWKALQSTDPVRSSPAIARDGTIYIGLPSGELHAIDRDGKEFQSQQLEGAIVSSPTVGDDGTVYVGALNTLYAITPGNQIRWKFRTFGAIFSSPAVGPDGTVYIGSEDGGLYAVVADPTQPDGSRSLWSDNGQSTRAQTTGGVRSSPLVTGDTVYVGSLDHNFYAFDRLTGNKKWVFQADSDVDSSPALGVDGNLYIASLNGTLYAVDPAGQQVWSVQTGQEIEGSPSVDKNGVIYLGTSSPDLTTGRLYAFDSATGKTLWSLDVTSPISSSPIIGADGTLYVGSGNNLLLIGQQQTVKPNLLYGDLNGNGKVDLPDAILALQMAVGIRTPTADQVTIGDVAPKQGTGGRAFGDGKIGIPDVIRILRRSLGLEPDPWPGG